MPVFKLYQQFTPIALPMQAGEEQEYSANLIHVGNIEAPDGDTALRNARELSRFKDRSKAMLLAFPIVENINGHADQDADDAVRVLPPD